MNPFNVGDEAKCVRAGVDDLDKNRIYVITAVDFDGWVSVVEGGDPCWDHTRFERIGKPKSKKTEKIKTKPAHQVIFDVL